MTIQELQDNIEYKLCLGPKCKNEENPNGTLKPLNDFNNNQICSDCENAESQTLTLYLRLIATVEYCSFIFSIILSAFIITFLVYRLI
jgi:hypothetical protein